VKKITATGQTVEEAVESALAQLKATRDQVEINIIDEGKKGLLGLFGNRDAVVEVTLKPDPIAVAKEYLQTVITKMGINAYIDVEQDGRIVEFEITGEKMGLLIGKRGQTLNSLQYLTQVVGNHVSDRYLTFLLNPEGYRERRKETLHQLAERLANKALALKKSVKLEPMPSFERKIIHTSLSNNENIETISEGKEPYRYIVIKPIL